MRSEFDVDVSDGLISPARLVVSDNRDARPSGAAPQMIVLHGISLPPGKFGGTEIEALFTNRLDWSAHPYFEEIRGFEVSAHLLIRRNGEVVQFVPFSERAWHAGESCFQGCSACNDFSIGIEPEGLDDEPYAPVQYERLVAVIRALVQAFPGLSYERIAGHADIAPGRKTDPGPAFDWPYLRQRLQDDSA